MLYFNTADGRWTEWSNWNSECSILHTKTAKRTRSCTNPAPTEDGLPCEGNNTEMAVCLGECSNSCLIHFS